MIGQSRSLAPHQKHGDTKADHQGYVMKRRPRSAARRKMYVKFLVVVEAADFCGCKIDLCTRTWSQGFVASERMPLLFPTYEAPLSGHRAQYRPSYRQPQPKHALCILHDLGSTYTRVSICKLDHNTTSTTSSIYATHNTVTHSPNLLSPNTLSTNSIGHSATLQPIAFALTIISI